MEIEGSAVQKSVEAAAELPDTNNYVPKAFMILILCKLSTQSRLLIILRKYVIDLLLSALSALLSIKLYNMDLSLCTCHCNRIRLVNKSHFGPFGLNLVLRKTPFRAKVLTKYSKHGHFRFFVPRLFVFVCGLKCKNMDSTAVAAAS